MKTKYSGSSCISLGFDTTQYRNICQTRIYWYFCCTLTPSCLLNINYDHSLALISYSPIPPSSIFGSIRATVLRCCSMKSSGDSDT